MGVAFSRGGFAIRLHMMSEDQWQLSFNNYPNDEEMTTVNILSTRGKEKQGAANHLKMMV